MSRAFAIVLASLLFVMLVFGCASQKAPSAPAVPAPPAGVVKSCSNYSLESCPDSCAVCPPCEACSSISCQTEQFCKGIGFNRSWYEEIKRNLAAYNTSVAGSQEPAGNPPIPLAQDRPAGKTSDYSTYLLYVPVHPNALNDSIFIVAFSPSGDASEMIGAWKAAAEKRGWPVFASKTFHNGADLPMSFNNDTFSDMGNASASLGYARPKFIFTGFSGGGQVSHAFAMFSPSKVAAVATNCGIINRGLLNATDYFPYPLNKTVLFIASPTDFRYSEMKEDRAYLEKLGWKTGWLEFAGGHMLAPQGTYEQAADWLEMNVGGKQG